MAWYRPKVYTASKTHHFLLWQSLASDPRWGHVEWTARWLEMAHLETKLSQEDQQRLADLKAANEAATSWGAAVSARLEEIKALESRAAANQPSDEDFQHFWTIDVTDVRRSDFVLLFGHETPEAPLRGAVFEAGVAVALGKTVLAVGLSASHTWSHHPLVVRLDTLEEARTLLLRYCTIPPARITPQS